MDSQTIKYTIILTIFLSFVTTTGADNPTIYIDQSIIESFERGESADILVWLVNNELTSPEYQEDYQIKQEEIKKAQDKVLALLSKEEFQLKYRYMTTNGFAGSLSKSGFEKLRTNKDVAKIYLDTPVYISLTESNPLVKIPDVGSMGFDGSGTTICVVDTGVNYTHSNLGGCFGPGCKVVMGYDFCNGPLCSGAPDPDPMDENGHGTHVSGIATSTHISLRGMAPSANLGAIKSFDSTGTSASSAVAAGIDYCVTYAQPFNIKVISMSFGDGLEHTGTCSGPYDDVLNNANNADIFLTAASGNELYTNGISYPACAKEVTSVGATYDADFGNVIYCADPGAGFNPPSCNQIICTDPSTLVDNITCFTNRGQNLDVLAPGMLINSTSITGTFEASGGTSQATPHVAGIVAVMYDVNPSLTPKLINNILKISGKKVYDPITSLTFPRVDTRKAVSYVGPPQIWTYDKLLTPDANSVSPPSIAIDSSQNIHVVWHDFVNKPPTLNYEIFYQKFNIKGKKITQPIQLTFNPAHSTEPIIAIDNDDFLHVIWEDQAYGNTDLFYKKLNKNGLSITPDVPITTASTGSQDASIAIDDNNYLHVVWEETTNQVYYKKLNMTGLNLTSNILLSEQPYSGNPSIGIDSSQNIHVVWSHKGSPSAIAYKKLDNNGTNLTSLIEVVPSGNQVNQRSPKLAINNDDTISLIWIYDNYISGCCYQTVRFMKLANNGTTIIQPIYLEFLGLFGGGNLDIAIDSKNNVHFTYYKKDIPTTNFEIIYTVLDSAGTIIEPATRITYDVAVSQDPTIAIDHKDNVHLVWDDYRQSNSTTTISTLYHKKTPHKSEQVLEISSFCPFGTVC